MRKKVGNIILWVFMCTLAGGIAFFAAVGGAQAQAVCSDRSKVVKNLNHIYSEAPVSIGLTTNGAVIEVFATKDGSTFTITLTTTDGITCLMAAGESWEFIVHNLPEGQGT